MGPPHDASIYAARVSYVPSIDHTGPMSIFDMLSTLRRFTGRTCGQVDNAESKAHAHDNLCPTYSIGMCFHGEGFFCAHTGSLPPGPPNFMIGPAVPWSANDIRW